MPLTIITVKNVPISLRGDLSKWMQEIATGVFVGNFNVRIRELLWQRVQEAAGVGEATLAYPARNEIGYAFQTSGGAREVIDCDGIPLVMMPTPERAGKPDTLRPGFSRASKMRRARRLAPGEKQRAAPKPYVVIDLETDGLDAAKNRIIEIGAVKVDGQTVSTFEQLIVHPRALPKKITELTGITDAMLADGGRTEAEAIKAFLAFIGSDDLVGYHVDFDVQFINQTLRRMDMDPLHHKVYDLMGVVKKEKMFQGNYKFETSLQSYGINEEVPHRALADAKLIYALSTKVKKFR
ncbi:type I-E CRISPR-associated endoribonuclease Cas2e [Pseudoramibacter faecis]|uniref:type I-E CRISPR-associated endoribonuclease Cas2e n=1 Tax=Pseudoramibacter faecis TaxID=3108534 RepID=UPI002E7872F4|nr:type I-E CRISPR-associated endoribonuclease Cas2e [Pseudoramibacter sp. HA2172]